MQVGQWFTFYLKYAVFLKKQKPKKQKPKNQNPQ